MHGLLLASTLAATAPAHEPHVHVTVPWIAAQLVPSPGLAWGDRGAALDLRWQVTPLLYSFGIHRRLSPWRFVVAEPLVRQSGSIELYLSPEYLAVAPAFDDRLLARVGVRSYFPLIERGDYLSMSVGTSYFHVAGRDAASYELGAYALFGTVGIQLVWSPGFRDAAWIATLRVRYF